MNRRCFLRNATLLGAATFLANKLPAAAGKQSESASQLVSSKAGSVRFSSEEVSVPDEGWLREHLLITERLELRALHG